MWCKNRLSDVGIPRHLSELGVQEKDDLLVKSAMADACTRVIPEM